MGNAIGFYDAEGEEQDFKEVFCKLIPLHDKRLSFGYD
jgi:hypothetical protein